MFEAGLCSIETDGRPAASRSAAARVSSPPDWTSIGLADLAASLGEASFTPDPRFAEVRFPVRRLNAGQILHRAGETFDAICAVRCGFFKTVRTDEAGTEQVLSFPMGGDVIGLDGVDLGRYTADVIALDTSHVTVVSFARIAQLGRQHAGVERLLYRLFSRELVREHTMMCLLGTLTADARVATFLLDLSERFARLGCSRSAFVLRMTRQDVGSYLGIKLETVSRTLSALCAAGLIHVDGKTITLRDMAGLRRIIEPEDDAVMRPIRRIRRAAA
jgi:CRP/FNR family transcriptional regulator